MSSPSKEILEFCPDITSREQIEASLRKQEFIDSVTDPAIDPNQFLEIDTLEPFQRARHDLVTPIASRELPSDRRVTQSLMAVIRSGDNLFGVVQASGRNIRNSDTHYMTHMTYEPPSHNAIFKQRLRQDGKTIVGGLLTNTDGSQEICPEFLLKMDGLGAIVVKHCLDQQRPLRVPLQVITAGPNYTAAQRKKHVLDKEDRTWSFNPNFLVNMEVFPRKVLRAEEMFTGKSKRQRRRPQVIDA